MSTTKKNTTIKEQQQAEEKKTLLDETTLSQAYRNCAHQLSEFGLLLQDIRYVGDPVEDRTWEQFENLYEKSFSIITAIRDDVSDISTQMNALRQLYRKVYAESNHSYPETKESRSALLPRLSPK